MNLKSISTVPLTIFPLVLICMKYSVNAYLFRPLVFPQVASSFHYRFRDDIINDMVSTVKKIDSLSRRYKIIPSYNIEHKKQSDNGGIELSMDLPGVRKEDINVQLEDNGRFLRISGKRISNLNNGSTNYIAEFNKVFRINECNLEVDKMNVSLKDGVLRVVAPEKDVSEYESIRKLPIIEKNEEGEDEKENHVTNLMKENDTPQSKTTTEYLDGLTITENTDEK